MELRQLRYFAAVAQRKHFGAAAAQAHVAQPALSRQVRDLETEIGVRLIDRRGRSIRLTDAGSVLAEEAERILQNISEAIEATRRAARDRADLLRIGIAGDFCGRHLGPILQAYRANLPTLAVEIREMTVADQQSALHAAELDLGFAPTPSPSDALVFDPLSQDALMIAFPADNPLASSGPIHLADLSEEPFLLPTNDPDLLALSKRLLADADIRPNVTQQATSMTMMLTMVAAGLGIALVPEVVGNSVPEGVRLVPLRSPKTSFEIGLLRRANDTSPEVSSFVEIAKEVVRQRERRTAGPARSRLMARIV